MGSKFDLDDLLAALGNIPDNIEIVRLQGYSLIVRMKETGTIAVVGSALLNFEKQLHRDVNPRIEVYLETLADTNILRRRDGSKPRETVTQ